MVSLVGLLWRISMLKENTGSVCKYLIEICGLKTVGRRGINCRA
jgi:hypothetical protein